MIALDSAALDRLQEDLDLAAELEAAALRATDPDARPDAEHRVAGRELIAVILPDVQRSTFGGFATDQQVAVVRSIIGAYPIREVAPGRVYVPELRAALRRWASAEQRRAVVLAS